MPDQKITYTQFRSEQIQEIISRRPGFFEKWSLWIFLIILILFFLGTWVIEYPDTIQSTGVLVAENAPREIICQQEGKIVKLFCQNESEIEQGKMIAWMESTADHYQVLALSDKLDSNISLLTTGKSEKVAELFRENANHLGTIQPSYQVFLTMWQQFTDYLSSGYYSKRKKSLYEEEQYLKKAHLTIEQQIVLVKKDMQLSEEAMKANNTLYDQKVISTQDIRDMKSKLYAKQMSLPQLESSLVTNEITQSEKRKEINELEHAISQQKTIFQQASQTLKSLIEEWKRKYIIYAPVSGKISFVFPIQENQYIQNGKKIGYINPPNSKYYALVTLPQGNFGKLTTGQKVQLRLDAYPFQEYGYVPGKLTYVSKVPTDSGFLANIELPNGFKSIYNIDLRYRDGLRFQALIVTKNTRLIKRFYYNIFKEVSR